MNLTLGYPYDRLAAHPSAATWLVRGGHMVGTLNSGASGLGSNPGRGHCVVFLGKTLYSHDAIIHPGVLMGTGEFNAGVTMR